ncbi:hypothetical protein [Parafrankia elaeagni]|uniref:hypothetical protein n=1 Tax=Parafrankia elaeagni TaxID=222534 RepID=UPI00036C7BC3|nr:hypothetical protein [Parafrankia elaeagni]
MTPTPPPPAASGPARGPVAGTGRAIGGILAIGGIAGVLRELVGMPPLLGFLRWFTVDGYEILCYALMVLAGTALCLAADRGTRRTRTRI